MWHKIGKTGSFTGFIIGGVKGKTQPLLTALVARAVVIVVLIVCKVDIDGPDLIDNRVDTVRQVTQGIEATAQVKVATVGLVDPKPLQGKSSSGISCPSHNRTCHIGTAGLVWLIQQSVALVVHHTRCVVGVFTERILEAIVLLVIIVDP